MAALLGGVRRVSKDLDEAGNAPPQRWGLVVPQCCVHRQLLTKDVECILTSRLLRPGSAQKAGSDLDVGRGVQDEGGEQRGLAGKGLSLDPAPPLLAVAELGQ